MNMSRDFNRSTIEQRLSKVNMMFSRLLFVLITRGEDTFLFRG